MNYYRVTKYNPRLRDKKGHYTVNDWTSMSDIGQMFSDGILTKEKYEQTENSYVNAVNIILTKAGVSSLTVRDLEITEDIKNLRLSTEERNILSKIANNLCINLHEIECVVRMVLRELLWCRLCSDMDNIEIEFGYDYYMYVRCNTLDASTEKLLLKDNIFVELISE